VIDAWNEGVSLENDSGKSILMIVRIVAADRWRLGSEHRRQANKLMVMVDPLYRSAVSRYYYAMYHAIRACVYLSHGGDDHEKHVELPRHIPNDFEPLVNWQNILKDAREIRNDADYNPYPKSDLAWRSNAERLKATTERLLVVSRRYLQNKGCTL
jgi:uncharacterized protein (UPF0332 family)